MKHKYSAVGEEGDGNMNIMDANKGGKGLTWHMRAVCAPGCGLVCHRVCNATSSSSLYLQHPYG